MSQAFQEHVKLKFQLYNSLFLTLPFGHINQTGTYLPLLFDACTKGFEKGKSPGEIIETFFDEYFSDLDQENRNNIIFNFIQYIERQVVLFDSVEDSAYSKVHKLNGEGTIAGLFERAKIKEVVPQLQQKLKDIKLRIVLTAHPTQFYPGSVLGIITDLNRAIKKDNVQEVNAYLKQLGKTPFLKKQKPTPYDEAVSLIWYLENVFYKSISNAVFRLEDALKKTGGQLDYENIVEMGFWPGGDRDGNPFVNTEITLKVANRLRRAIQIMYFRDVRVLKRRLTFPGIYDQIQLIEKKLYDGINREEDIFHSAEELLNELRSIKQKLIQDYQSLFIEEVNKMITKVKIFGLYFAIIDIRQDSSIHEALFQQLYQKNTGKLEDYSSLDDKTKIDWLETLEKPDVDVSLDDPILQDTLDSFPLMQNIQELNGDKACHRYIISNSQSSVHVMQAYQLAKLLRTDMKVDIVPLFETIDDLQNASTHMEYLYSHEAYRKHLTERNDVQTIMLGFSDGTKDGGYLSANFSIYEAKEALTAMSRKYNVNVVFFDGRGGPPARGGGKTHKFYASLGNTIEDKQVQITIQGQTISSNFGTPDSARYNIEQLLTAGVENDVFSDGRNTLSEENKEVLKDLADSSLDAYKKFKHHPQFLDYLEEMGTLPYYGETNIGSRPVKRAGGGKLTLSKLRAIPFVGSWSQMKQNVPGYYGLGIAIQEFYNKGEIDKVAQLYQQSKFFQALVQNSMQSLAKCYFPLTAYLKDHVKYGEIWNTIHDEYNRTKKMLLLISGESDLLESEPNTQESIKLRENLVLPLLTIQQYALEKTRKETSAELVEIYHKMVLRTMFGIINAGRNSA